MMKKLFFSLLIGVLSASPISAQQKTDVWDFGAKQLDESLYNNHLTETVINAWYTVAPGTSNVTMPTSFTAGRLSWTGGTNDRLRTSNTSLTRYDANVGSGAAAGFTGRLYVNASAAVGRFLTLQLEEDDEVTVFGNSDAAGMLNFINVANPALQTDQRAVSTTTSEYKFVAKAAGSYKIVETVNKPSYYQIQRKAATYATVSGTVNTTNTTTVPADYAVVFTNEAGKSWSATVTGGNFSVNLPVNYNYSLSLANANGYVITEGETLAVTPATTSHNIEISQVDLYKLSGSIVGLNSDINNLGLVFTPDPVANTVFVPKPVIDKVNATYSVNLEANIPYTISATGVNDEEILANTITVLPQETQRNIVFSAKPRYSVAINAVNLTMAQASELQLTFTNVNEPGYSYTFNGVSAITLRDGTYSIFYAGLDAYPLEMQSTSYTKVNGAATSKNLTFLPVSDWSFDDKVITNATPKYKGISFTGNVSNEIAKGHLICQTGSTVSVPMNPGDKLVISYYYAANFSIDGQPAVTTDSGSTSTVENTSYVYSGSTPGTVVISAAATTYLTHISKFAQVAYASEIRVGADKPYTSINAALKAVSRMERSAGQRVTVLIDPGNYEEMLVISSPDITLKNASLSPSIALANKGVDIDPNAVRITSYYGVGYNYFSQGTDNKWSETALNINKENGFTNYTNVSGTTNNSYWNATVVIAANNFRAENIIFENSFNQYISQKESEDVLVLVTGNKGVRPTTPGDVAVQNRSFVERAAALAVTNNTDKVFLDNCRVVGRQDSFYGGTNARVAVYKGVMMGAVDYIFGPMNATFYQSKFAMNVSDVSTDAAYLTAPQHLSGRGYLLYECTITSAIPGIETASAYRAKPGYFGRPWAVNTGEAVMYKTTVETSDAPGYQGLSLIAPAGWQNTLSGTSDRVYEYQTNELSGVNNAPNRAPWSKVLTTPYLTEGIEITPFNFTRGNDNWDPFSEAVLAVSGSQRTKVNAYSAGRTVYITDVKAPTVVKVYSMNAALVKYLSINADKQFDLSTGVYLVTMQSSDGIKTVKVLIK